MKARRTCSCKRSPNSSWSSSLLFLALLAVATTASAQSTLHRTIRRAGRGPRAGDARMAPPLSRASRAVEPRGRDVEVRGGPTPQLRPRTQGRRRASRGRRHAARRAARTGRCAARRHGCAAREGRGWAAVREHRDRRVRRAQRASNARLRPRRAHGDAAGDGEDSVRAAAATARHGDVHLPTCRGGSADERASRRCGSDGARGRAQVTRRGCGVRRPRLRQHSVRPHRVPERTADGRIRSLRDPRAGPANAWREPVERR